MDTVGDLVGLNKLLDEMEEHPMRFTQERAGFTDAIKTIRAAISPCDIEPAFSQHEYAVDYCETHDQPADLCPGRPCPQCHEVGFHRMDCTRGTT